MPFEFAKPEPVFILSTLTKVLNNVLAAASSVKAVKSPVLIPANKNPPVVPPVAFATVTVLAAKPISPRAITLPFMVIGAFPFAILAEFQVIVVSSAYGVP